MMDVGGNKSYLTSFSLSSIQNNNDDDNRNQHDTKSFIMFEHTLKVSTRYYKSFTL